VAQHTPSPTQIDDLLQDTSELDPDLVRDRPVTGATSVERGQVIMRVGAAPGSGSDPPIRGMSGC
jgi:hypothetical protein